MSDYLLDENIHTLLEDIRSFKEDDFGHIWNPQCIIYNLTSGAFSYKRQCQKCQVLSDDKHSVKMCLWAFR